MKKQKRNTLLLCFLCAVFLIGIIVTANSYSKLMKSSKRPADVPYAYHLSITESFDSFYIEKTKYVRLENTDKIPDSVQFGHRLGRISDFVPSFKKYAYSISGIVLSSDNGSLLKVSFTNGTIYYFVCEKMLKQYS